MSPSNISGYKVLTLKYNEKCKSQHYLYAKQHTVREKCEQKPTERTLFLLGIPPYCTEESLKDAFEECGTVDEVYFHSKPTSAAPSAEESDFFKTIPEIKGFKVAYLVFQNPSGVKRALNLDSTTPLILSKRKKPVMGLQKWINEYNSKIPDVEFMQKDINKFMAAYDTKEESTANEDKEKANADDEGWVTVTKKGRRPGLSRKQSVGKNIMRKENKKRSKKELLNFYRFQIRESKMNNLIKLRDKFEEDKKKIALLKQSRKFKPFK